MPTWIGSFKNGSPVLKVSIPGDRGRRSFQAIIDTGFSGFGLMPLSQARKLGLPLSGVTSVVYADGRRSARPTAFARVAVGRSKDIEGLIILEPRSEELLLGTEFLRATRKVLVLDMNTPGVELRDASKVAGRSA